MLSMAASAWCVGAQSNGAVAARFDVGSEVWRRGHYAVRVAAEREHALKVHGVVESTGAARGAGSAIVGYN